MVKSGLSSAWMRADQRSPPRGLAAAPPVSFSRVEGGSAQLSRSSSPLIPLGVFFSSCILMAYDPRASELSKCPNRTKGI